MKDGLSLRSVFNRCFLGPLIFLISKINVIASKVIWSLVEKKHFLSQEIKIISMTPQLFQ